MAETPPTGRPLCQWRSRGPRLLRFSPASGVATGVSEGLVLLLAPTPVAPPLMRDYQGRIESHPARVVQWSQMGPGAPRELVSRVPPNHSCNVGGCDHGYEHSNRSPLLPAR